MTLWELRQRFESSVPWWVPLAVGAILALPSVTYYLVCGAVDLARDEYKSRRKKKE